MSINSDRLPIRYAQQEFQPPPQQPIKHHRTASYYAHRVHESFTGRVAKVICAIFLSLLVVLGIVAFILWLSLRPHRPRFHLIDFRVPSFSQRQPAGRFDNAQITFNVTARNPNQNIGIYYDSMVGSVFYKDQKIGTTLPLRHPFYQEPETTSIVDATFGAATVNVNRNRRKELMNERRHGTVVFRLDITSVIRFKVSTWYSKHHKMHVDCNVAVGPEGFVLPAWKNKKCPVYFS